MTVLMPRTVLNGVTPLRSNAGVTSNCHTCGEYGWARRGAVQRLAMRTGRTPDLGEERSTKMMRTPSKMHTAAAYHTGSPVKTFCFQAKWIAAQIAET